MDIITYSVVKKISDLLLADYVLQEPVIFEAPSTATLQTIFQVTGAGILYEFNCQQYDLSQSASSVKIEVTIDGVTKTYNGYSFKSLQGLKNLKFNKSITIKASLLAGNLNYGLKL